MLRQSQIVQNLLFLILLLLGHGVMAQTGPGGVDDVLDPEDLFLWLRADEGLYVDPGCLIPAREGDPVGCWIDQSGRGFHAIQRIDDSRPTSIAASPALNDRPTLRFDGNSDWLLTEAIPAINVQERTLIAVIQNGEDSGTNYQHILHYGVNGFVKAYGICFTTNPRQTQTGEGNIGNHYWSLGFASRLEPTDDALLLRMQYDGRNDFLYANGRLQGQREVRLRTGQTDGIRIGSRIRSDTGREFFFGDIAEVVVFQGRPDPVQTLMVENYLSSKYGIPLALTDRFEGDRPENGDYDLDLAGIGRERNGQQLHGDSAGMALRNRSFLVDAGDFMLFAHREVKNRVVTSDLPSEVPARFARVWQIQGADTGVINGGRVDVIFDFEAAGVGRRPRENTNFHLLQRQGTSGPFTSVATSNQIAGEQVRFFEVDLPTLLETGTFFTLGLFPDTQETDITIELRQAADPSRSALNYALEVRNLSLVTPIEGIDVRDVFPEELYNILWICRADEGSSCRSTPGFGDVRDTIDLAPGGRAIYTIRASLAPNSEAVTNAATVSLPAGLSDPDPANNSATITFEPATDSVDLVVSLDNGESQVEVGQTVNYTLIVGNRGPNAANNATVTTTANRHLAPCEWTCEASGGASCDAELDEDGELNATVNLPTGGELVYTAQCRVNGPILGLGALLKTATVAPNTQTVDRHPSNNLARQYNVISRPGS